MKQRFDAIIVLGGGIDSNDKLSERSLARIKTAVNLHSQGLSKNLIICGGWPLDLISKPSITEARAMRLAAIKLGVPDNAIFIEEESRDTIGNACHVKSKILEPLGCESLLVVTSASHCPRAKYIFSKVLGDGYALKTSKVPEKFSLYRVYYEFVAIMAALKILRNVSSGDDRSALTIVSSPEFNEKYKWHPAKSLLALIVPDARLVLSLFFRRSAASRLKGLF